MCLKHGAESLSFSTPLLFVFSPPIPWVSKSSPHPVTLAALKKRLDGSLQSPPIGAWSGEPVRSTACPGAETTVPVFEGKRCDDSVFILPARSLGCVQDIEMALRLFDRVVPKGLQIWRMHEMFPRQEQPQSEEGSLGMKL